ncbi:hypothetical protein Tco_0520409, partial [Tanacetum coccineum]
VLSKEDLKGTHIEYGFKRTFMSLFGQDDDTFTSMMLLNVDQLQKKLDKDEFQEDGSMAAFWVINRQFQNSGTESRKQDTSSKSGNDVDADNVDIKPIYDEKPMDEVQLTAECYLTTIGQQHTEQPEIINEGKVDQYTEQCQVKSPMLDSSIDNKTTEFSNQSLDNKAKMKKEIDAFETINIELEHSMAKLLTVNENLNKENKTLKKDYKDLYDSIKITRAETIEQTTSLITQNADLKAQIQENVFAIAALKNELRKPKGNSVDTKFAKPSILGKPILQPLRNQSVV